MKDSVTYCSVCHNITDVDPCRYCADEARDQRVICVVEEPQNVNVIEKSRGFRGVYHVLMGTISPLQGVGPDDLKIKALLARIDGGRVDEVILATSPTVEGEATAIYLARLLRPLGVRVTRIATGIPGGQRPRVRRRAHDGQSHGGTARRLLARPRRSRIVRRVREMLPISYQIPAALVLLAVWPHGLLRRLPPAALGARGLRLHHRRPGRQLDPRHERHRLHGRRVPARRPGRRRDHGGRVFHRRGAGWRRARRAGGDADVDAASTATRIPIWW